MQPDSLSAHTEFRAQFYLLRADEGGRRTPIFDRYRPHLLFGTVEVPGEVRLPEGVDLLVPGDTLEVTFRLAGAVPVLEGVQFSVLEDRHAVGAGTVTRILG